MTKTKGTDTTVRRIFPGRLIAIEEGEVKLAVHVYPPGLHHLERFSTRIAAALGLISNMDLRPAMSGDSVERREFAQAVLSRVAPLVLGDMLGMVRECCVIEVVEGQGECAFEDLPHWHAATVLEAWIEESFLEERKWRPWKEALEKLIGKATGRPFSISEMLSRPSSQPDTNDRTSSDANDPDGPTEDGAFQSSGSGSGRQNA